MRRPALVLLLGVAAGCASKADVETLGDSLRTDLGEIRASQDLLFEQMRSELADLDAAGMQRETTGRGEIERRVARLEDSINELLEIVGQNNQLLNDLYENRLSSRSGSPSVLPAEGTDSGSRGSDEPSVFYAMALEQYNRGNLETARGAFRNFLAENGDHELAPDAQYYVARTYEDEVDVGNALDEYRRVTELYPDSNRAPAALYRRGLLEAKQGNTAVARRMFVQIGSGYANSPEAPLARRELQKLGG